MRSSFLEQSVVALERLRPALARGVDMDSLVVGQKDKFRGFVDVEAVIELLLPQHGKGGRAGFGMRYLRERLGDFFCKSPVPFRSDDLAEIDLAAVPEAVGARRWEADLHHRRLLVWKAVCDFGGVRSRVLRRRYGCSVTKAEVAGFLEPSVGVKEPVRGLHAVVGDDEHRRLLAPKPFRLLDQMPARSIDCPVDLHQLLP